MLGTPSFRELSNATENDSIGARMHKLRLAEEHTKRYHGRVLIAPEKMGGKKYGDSVLDSTGKRVGERHNERFLAASR